MTGGLDFPPLLTGVAVAGDPFAAALASVASDVNPGHVFYGLDDTSFDTAIILAPEEPLAMAVRASFAITLGLNDALGALAPPEVAVHLVWPDGIKVNGALCGQLRVVSDTSDPLAEPDWMVIGLKVPVLGQDTDPGGTPDQTSLHDEGCGDVTAPALIEAWGRHMMNWLHIYLTDGFHPLHREWSAKGDGFGGQITYPAAGTFVGLDENGGLILKDDADTRILPLTDMVSTP
ncbi:MAG: DUF4444 domain-containing protein [Silicimonas sp.]|nr:DUF4444 domain-containing protein [Silicimonas sp.]